MTTTGGSNLGENSRVVERTGLSCRCVPLGKATYGPAAWDPT